MAKNRDSVMTITELAAYLKISKSTLYKLAQEHKPLAWRICEQLKVMGWEWLEGDIDVPELTERANFREVLLKERLATALRKINLRDGRPWLDDTRIASGRTRYCLSRYMAQYVQ